MRPELILITALALSAFAANSVLCRLALEGYGMNPVTFTQIRLLAGAVFLVPFFYNRRAKLLPIRGADWRSPLALFTYAITFSLAYVTLNAGAGALILFGAVQVTMIGAGIVRGQRPTASQYSGVVLAFAGLVYLLLPGLSAPPLAGAALMGIAGCAWGIYSLFGKTSDDPVGTTARNFLLAAPMALALFASRFFASGFYSGSESLPGIPAVLIAIASGALASGAGYVLWYRALKGLSRLNASVVQLAVPVIAAIGGALFIGETISIRLLIAAALILGGILITLRSGNKSGKSDDDV